MPSDSASSFGWASSDGRVYKLKTDMQLHSFEYYVYIKWGMRIIITHVVYELPTLWDNLPVFAKNLLSYCKCFLLWTSKLTAIDNCISHVKSTRPLRWIGTLRLYWWHLHSHTARRWVADYSHRQIARGFGVCIALWCIHMWKIKRPNKYMYVFRLSRLRLSPDNSLLRMLGSRAEVTGSASAR